MNNFRKRIGSLLLIFTIFMGILPHEVFATDTESIFEKISSSEIEDTSEKISSSDAENTFEKISTIDEIKDGYYVLYGDSGTDKKALGNNKDGSYMSALDVTESSDTITNPQDSAIWYIDVDENTGKISLQGKEHSQYLDITSNATKGFEMVGYKAPFSAEILDTTKGSVFLKAENNASGSRGISIFTGNTGKTDFRAYTASNYKDLYLYRLTNETENAIPPTQVGPPVDPPTNKELNIKEVLELPTNTENVTVKGQFVFNVTDYDNAIIQDTIDGKVYSLYIFGSVPKEAKIGDIVEFTGKYTIYNGLPELVNITNTKIIETDKQPIEVETFTIKELETTGLNMLGRYIKIEDVTLGKFNGSGSTPITDKTGTINIFKSTAYPEGVTEGDIVDVYAMVSCYNKTVQLMTGKTSYVLKNDNKAPNIILNDTFLPAKVGQDYLISTEIKDASGIKEVSITYEIKDMQKTENMILNSENNKYEFSILGSEITKDIDSFKFKITAIDNSINENIAKTEEKTIIVDNKPQITEVSPAKNSQTGDDKAPLIYVKVANAGDNPTIKLSLQKDGVEIFKDASMILLGDKYTYNTTNLEDGKYTAIAKVLAEDGRSTTENWNFTVGKAEYQKYYGQFHSHTTFSDGSGSLENGFDYLKSIPAEDNVDFISFTDHSNYFDTKDAPNPAEALNDKEKMTAESKAKWEEYTSKTRNFNEENKGSLVTLPGFEMTWSGGPGHINTFNSTGLVSRNNTTLNNKTGGSGMQSYYDVLTQNTDPLQNLSQFNHPGKTFGNFLDFGYYSQARDNKMVTVEIGNGEGAIGSGGYFPSYEQYTLALDKGWHVAPTNNQDNHKGRWGNANTARTVVVTNDLSEEGILTALSNRSLYATEDKNLEIDYMLNDEIMGSIIAEVPTAPLKFNINVNDPNNNDNIAKVEIVTNNGRIATSQNFSTNSVNWEFELPATQGYYYVRVTQADKNIAVTSPIWIGSAPLLGINSVEVDTKMPVTNEKITIKTEVFNNETIESTLKEVTYKIGNQVLKTNVINKPVASLSTEKDTFEYTPTKASKETIDIMVTMELNGEEKIFTSKVELNIRDAEKLVYVGIDASNYNEYVNGNYKDSMGNFTNLAIEYNIRVEELKTEADLIAATKNPKYEMLVLTPPTRRNGNSLFADYQNWSDEEIKAISDFSKAGNTIIITGWGDYYENYKLPNAEDHMAYQQNKILKEIGASLRISDDEIKDNITNGGQPQRLYLKEYNMSNPFLNRVDKDAQVFSCYGGSTIYMVDEAGNPTTNIPASVSKMVSAFDTSHSDDDDKDNYAGIEIPKYDGKYLVVASETINHKNGNQADVIVAGSVFMSNFEIQVDSDNYGTPAYSNYTIIENILKNINPVEITNIADVHKAAEGEQFTIRGIATSNASGYDKETAFFDSIYVQDSTAGINLFPVSGNVKAGDTIEITGITSSYNGERQLKVEKITILDKTTKVPQATKITTKDATEYKYLGSLVEINGVVTKIVNANGIPESIYVKDNTGVETRVFIDGYITKDKKIENLEVGANIKAIGLSSKDTSYADINARIRIRNRDDIVCSKNSGGGSGGSSGGGSSSSNTNIGSTTQTTNKDGTITTSIVDKNNEVTSTTKYSNGIEIIQKIDKNGNMLSIDVTGVKGTSTITIPLDKKPSAGNVAVIVNEDGTYKIIEKSFPVEEGMTITLNKDAKIKIINNSKYFVDTPKEWYKEAINFVSARELFVGTSKDKFSPEDKMTRAMLWSVLYRLEVENTKTDGEKWYSSAQEWVKTTGISDGLNAENEITREQIATILYRLKSSPQADNDTVNKFIDSENINEWAIDAMNWAIESSLFVGNDNKELNANNMATRAEVAMILMKYIMMK